MTSDPYQSLQDLLQKQGLKAGLAFLNDRVPHRFTAVYRLDDMMLRRVELVDKGGSPLEVNGLEAVPLETSFCQFVLRDGQFVTSQSASDTRLDGHPYQGVVGSYIGLPLQGGGDKLFGTFCHFDFSEQPVNDEEFAFLQRVARLLPRYL
ncbi:MULTISPECIES: GAF domain-containing protein [Polaromonas]|uniref:GAF domain-containing protein n=1 Tax=Polaromonas aquatica TaxID=332657 RepID=A0ABW1TSX7_9BURK